MKSFLRAGVAGFLFTGVFLFASGASVARSSTAAEPMFTQYARIYESPTLNFRTEYFKDKPMEEMTGFDGYTLSLNFTYPFNDRSQLRVLMPFYTDGNGTYDNPGDRADGAHVNVKGYGGVLEFPSVIYERRFGWLEGKTGANVAWLAGAGRRLDTLKVRDGGTEVDRFNHTGYNFQFGLKMDSDIRQGDMTLLGNLRYVGYLDSDDINLSSGGGTQFGVLYTTGAVKFNNYGRFTPVVEAILEADFSEYTAFSLAPEAIYTIKDDFDVKLAVPFRLTSDGQQYAIDVDLTYRF